VVQVIQTVMPVPNMLSSKPWTQREQGYNASPNVTTQATVLLHRFEMILESSKMFVGCVMHSAVADAMVLPLTIALGVVAPPTLKECALQHAHRQHTRPKDRMERKPVIDAMGNAVNAPAPDQMSVYIVL
jgi:hypothetical protein